MARGELDSSSAPAPVVALDERRLLVRHRRGDPHAFSELVACYRAPVYSYLVRCGLPSPVRDDLFQESFTKVHAAAATYEADRPLKPWLFTIVANTVRTHFRRQKVQRLVYPDSPLPEAQDPSASALEEHEAKETATWLDEAIQALPLNHREVLLLSCVENMSDKDVSRVLDLPIGTIKTYRRRARQQLAKALVKRKTSTTGGQI